MLFFKEIVFSLDFTLYGRLYYAFCFFFLFFKRNFSLFLNIVKLHKYLYINIFGGIYLIRVRLQLYNFSSMRHSSVYWLFFLFFHDKIMEKKQNFKWTDTFNLWSFFVYCVVSSQIIFGFKSKKVLIGFWPKYLETPSDLFKVMLILPNNFKNVRCTPFVNLNKIGSFAKNKFRQNIVLNAVQHKLNFFFYFVQQIKNVIQYKIENAIVFFCTVKKWSYALFYLRKQKFFNKGRYSRNRQLYRTGVYWCIYVNVVAVLGLNFLFYKFTINFSQYWWFLFIIAVCVIFSNFVKSGFYNYIKIDYFSHLPNINIELLIKGVSTAKYLHLIDDVFFLFTTKYGALFL